MIKGWMESEMQKRRRDDKLDDGIDRRGGGGRVG